MSSRPINGGGERTRPRALIPILGAATLIAYVAQAAARETYPVGEPIRLATTFVLLGCIGSTIWSIVHGARSLDEFERQVQLTALAFAFPISLVFTFAIGFLAGEGLLRGADPRDLPVVMLVSYFAGVVAARRRYQ